MFIDDIKFFYVHRCKTAKEMWNALEMIYKVFPSIKQEEMDTRGEEDEHTSFKCFSKFRNIRNYIGTFVANQCLRVKNWKFNQILKSKDGSLHEFKEKSRKN